MTPQRVARRVHYPLSTTGAIRYVGDTRKLVDGLQPVNRVKKMIAIPNGRKIRSDCK